LMFRKKWISLRMNLKILINQKWRNRDMKFRCEFSRLWVDDHEWGLALWTGLGLVNRSIIFLLFQLIRFELVSAEIASRFTESGCEFLDMMHSLIWSSLVVDLLRKFVHLNLIADCYFMDVNFYVKANLLMALFHMRGSMSLYPPVCSSNLEEMSLLVSLPGVMLPLVLD
jgi:hypothetical protein